MSKLAKQIFHQKDPATEPDAKMVAKLKKLYDKEDYQAYYEMLAEKSADSTPGWKSALFSDARHAREKMIALYTEQTVVAESGLQCKKCGSKKTFSVQEQTRSADEGGTNFVVCGNCGSKWTFS